MHKVECKTGVYEWQMWKKGGRVDPALYFLLGSIWYYNIFRDKKTQRDTLTWKEETFMPSSKCDSGINSNGFCILEQPNHIVGGKKYN